MGRALPPCPFSAPLAAARGPHGIPMASPVHRGMGSPWGPRVHKAMETLLPPRAGGPEVCALPMAPVEPGAGAARTHRRAHPEASRAVGDSMPPSTPNPSPSGVPQVTYGCPTKPTGSSQPGPPLTYPGCLKIPPQPHLRCCALVRASSAASSMTTPCNCMLSALRLLERRRQWLRGDKKGPSLHSPTPKDGPGEGLRVGTCVHVWACVRAHGYGHTAPMAQLGADWFGVCETPARGSAQPLPPARSTAVPGPCAGCWVIDATLEPPLGWDSFTGGPPYCTHAGTPAASGHCRPPVGPSPRQHWWLWLAGCTEGATKYCACVHGNTVRGTACVTARPRGGCPWDRLLGNTVCSTASAVPWAA